MSSDKPTPSASGSSVPVSVEAVDEWKVYEYDYDGEEKYIPPVTYEEEITHNIQRIDFNQPIEELRAELEGNDPQPNPQSEIQDHTISSESWPYLAVKKKLLAAYTEICVLLDVLTIAKTKNHMVCSIVNSTPTEQSPLIEVLSKKRGFEISGDLLAKGADVLRKFKDPKIIDSLSSTTSGDTRNLPLMENYYSELANLKKLWRLKRSNGLVIGDVSFYKPSGRFTGNSRFEILKSSPEQSAKSESHLSIKLETGFETKTYIEVAILTQDEQKNLEGSAITGQPYQPVTLLNWRSQLQNAQDSLYVNDLFSFLVREAMTCQFSIPPMITGNQIVLCVFPHVRVYVTLVACAESKSCEIVTPATKYLSSKRVELLEEMLDSMYFEYFLSMMQQRQQQSDELWRDQIALPVDSSQKQDGFLENFVKICQHYYLRRQTSRIIDHVAHRIKDPLMVAHWLCLNNATNSQIRLDIVSNNNETLGRAHLSVKVKTQGLQMLTREGRGIYLSYEEEELTHYLVWQASLHQFGAALTLSKLLGWLGLSLSYNVGAICDEEQVTAFSAVIVSPNCEYMLSLLSGPLVGIQIKVARFKDSAEIDDIMASSKENLFTDRRYMEGDENRFDLKPGEYTHHCFTRLQNLVGTFREIDYDKTFGKDFLSKFEMILAALTTPNF